MKSLRLDVWTSFWPSKQIPGQWIAHCLDFDIVTQGDSLEHAAEMLAEATLMVAKDDLARDKNPFDRGAINAAWADSLRERSDVRRATNLALSFPKRGKATFEIGAL